MSRDSTSYGRGRQRTAVATWTWCTHSTIPLVQTKVTCFPQGEGRKQRQLPSLHSLLSEELPLGIPVRQVAWPCLPLVAERGQLSPTSSILRGRKKKEQKGEEYKGWRLLFVRGGAGGVNPHSCWLAVLPLHSDWQLLTGFNYKGHCHGCSLHCFVWLVQWGNPSLWSQASELKQLIK